MHYWQNDGKYRLFHSAGLKKRSSDEQIEVSIDKFGLRITFQKSAVSSSNVPQITRLGGIRGIIEILTFLDLKQNFV